MGRDSRSPKRTNIEVELREVSVVSEPAYDGTTIVLRCLEDTRKERRHCAGFVKNNLSPAGMVALNPRLVRGAA